MIALLTKPLDDITEEDVRALIATRVPEGDRIEFKRALPVRKGNADPWLDNRLIGDHAKHVIVDEIVAFANTYGGTLVLGVNESKARPAVAESVQPIASCEDLAERLKLVIRDAVDPQLPGLEVKAVPIASGEGVVVLRTRPSRLAPHRSRRTKRCMVRRADRCEELTMREIQDMTLNVARGLRRVEKNLEARRQEFDRQCETLGDSGGSFGLRITGTPVGHEPRIDTVVQNGTIDERFVPPPVQVARVTSDTEPDGRPLPGIEAVYAMNRQDWVPRLRAVRAQTLNQSHGGEMERRAYLEVQCDGLVETAFLSRLCVKGPADRTAPMPLVDTVPIAEFAITCMWADRVRRVSGAPGAEYAIEVQIRVTRGSASVETPARAPGMRWRPFAALPAPGILFPRYSLGAADETGVLCEILERDFWNAMGKDIAADQGRIRVAGV